MDSNSPKTRLPVVSVDWLKAHQHDNRLRIVDGSWHLPAAGRDAFAEFNQGHIPGAVFFDLDKHSAPSDLPHMLPDAVQFSRAAGSLGISDTHIIVVYDTVGLFSAARIWWMFRHFGAREVFVLDGGLPAWLESTGELTTVADSPAPCTFEVTTAIDDRGDELADVSMVQNAMSSKSCLILDARPAGRFSGVEKEARAGLRSGHIPGSINMPFKQVLNSQGRLKSVPELKQLFESLSLHDGMKVVTTCGSGVTAAVLCLALSAAGHDNVALYDGSWSEWGGLDDTPVDGPLGLRR